MSTNEKKETGLETAKETQTKAEQPDPKKIRTLDELTPAQKLAHEELVSKNPVTNQRKMRAVLQPQTKEQRATKLQKVLKKSVEQNLLSTDPKTDLEAKANLLDDRTSTKKKKPAKAE